MEVVACLLLASMTMFAHSQTLEQRSEQIRPLRTVEDRADRGIYFDAPIRSDATVLR
jgi:hypothetical protein